MLTAWVRALLSMANCMMDSGNKTFTSDCEERLYLKVNTVIGHDMMYIHPKLSDTSQGAHVKRSHKHIAIIMGLKPRSTV